MKSRAKGSFGLPDCSEPGGFCLFFPYVSLGLALACTVRATILPGDDPSAHLSDMEVRFALVLSTLTALAASLIALRTRERENRASPAAGDGAAC